jgi:hypothetical protein
LPQRYTHQTCLQNPYNNGEGRIRTRPSCYATKQRFCLQAFFLQEITSTIRYYSNTTSEQLVT